MPWESASAAPLLTRPTLRGPALLRLSSEYQGPGAKQSQGCGSWRARPHLCGQCCERRGFAVEVISELKILLPQNLSVHNVVREDRSVVKFFIGCCEKFGKVS
jgi:hypothetical protein